MLRFNDFLPGIFSLIVVQFSVFLLVSRETSASINLNPRNVPISTNDFPTIDTRPINQQRCIPPGLIPEKNYSGSLKEIKVCVGGYSTESSWTVTIDERSGKFRDSQYNDIKLNFQVIESPKRCPGDHHELRRKKRASKDPNDLWAHIVFPVASYGLWSVLNYLKWFFNGEPTIVGSVYNRQITEVGNPIQLVHQRLIGFTAGRQRVYRTEAIYAVITTARSNNRGFDHDDYIFDYLNGRRQSPKDERGHLVARRFGGPATLYNLAPQSPRTNRNLGMPLDEREFSWCRMERSIARWIEDGRRRDVIYELRVSYDENTDNFNGRPTHFLINLKFRQDEHVYHDEVLIFENADNPNGRLFKGYSDTSLYDDEF